jgi:hypothetical protein
MTSFADDWTDDGWVAPSHVVRDLGTPCDWYQDKFYCPNQSNKATHLCPLSSAGAKNERWNTAEESHWLQHFPSQTNEAIHFTTLMSAD